MEIKTIRDVDENTWNNFKALAAKSNLKMSLLLKIMVKETEKKSEIFWKKILDRNKMLSDKEAEIFEKDLELSRKERGFRK